MSLNRTEKVAVGVGVVLVLVIVLAAAYPAQAATVRQAVQSPPPLVPIEGDRFVVLRTERGFYAHDDGTELQRTLQAGQRLKVVESYPITSGGRRWYRAYTMTGTHVDGGPQTRGYLFLADEEFDEP